jgi:hypothetical protein
MRGDPDPDRSTPFGFEDQGQRTWPKAVRQRSGEWRYIAALSESLLHGLAKYGDGLARIAAFDPEQPRQTRLSRYEPDDRFGGYEPYPALSQ